MEWGQIQGLLRRIGPAGDHRQDRVLPGQACAARGLSAASITETDFLPPYLDAVENFADLDRIAKSGKKFCIDSMYGAGGTILSDIFKRIGVEHVQIRSRPDPLFPGINPEPIEPHIRALGEAVVANRCDAGLCTDGDADRIGDADEHGNFVDPHKIYSVLLNWVLERKGWPGAVTRAFNTTKMLDRIAKKHGRELLEHGIGFKFVCDYMLEREILMGGEESGGIGLQRHLPERDGILNALLLANVMAEEGKTLGELVAALQAEYGEHQYGRIDLHIPDAVKNSAIARARALQPGDPVFAEMPVLRTETLDGVKLYLENPEATTKPNAAETWHLAAAARQRNRAAAAHLHRILFQRRSEKPARLRPGIRFGKLKATAPPAESALFSTVPEPQAGSLSELRSGPAASKISPLKRKNGFHIKLRHCALAPGRG